MPGYTKEKTKRSQFYTKYWRHLKNTENERVNLLQKKKKKKNTPFVDPVLGYLS